MSSEKTSGAPYLPTRLWPAALGALMGCAAMWLLALLLLGELRPAQRLIWADFFPEERNAAFSYRFSYPSAGLLIAEPHAPGSRLTIRAFSPPPLPPRPLEVTAFTHGPLFTVELGAEPRTLRVLLPPPDPRGGGLGLGLRTPAATPAGDTRALGMLFSEIRLVGPQPAPDWPLLLPALLVPLAVGALMLRLGLGPFAAGGAALLLAMLAHASVPRTIGLGLGLAALGLLRQKAKGKRQKLAARSLRKTQAPRPAQATHPPASTGSAGGRAAGPPPPLSPSPPPPLSPPAWAAVALVLAHTAWTGYHALLNHSLYGTHTYDLGLYDQTFWLISHGYPSYSTGAGINMLGSHAALILYPLAALYWLLPDVRLLLLAQSFATALGAIPLYLFGRDRGLPWAGVLAGAAYLLHPSVQNMALFDFHVDTIAATAMLYALWAADTRRWKALFAACVVILFCKENFAIPVAMLGLLLAARRQWRVGAALGLGGAAWFLIATQLVVPAFLAQDASLHVSRFTRYGDSVPEIMLTMALNPQLVLADMLKPDAPAYLLALLLPLALLPLLSPYALVALPTVGINLLSATEAQRTTSFHYSALAVAALAAAGLHAACWVGGRLRGWSERDKGTRGQGDEGTRGHAGFDKLSRQDRGPRQAQATHPAQATPHAPHPAPYRLSAIGYRLSKTPRQVLPFAFYLLPSLMLIAAIAAQITSDLRQREVADRAALGSPVPAYYDYMVGLIPPGAGVSASGPIQPHLTHRQQAFMFPNPFVVADFYNPAAMPFTPQADYILYDTRRFDRLGASPAAKARLLDELRAGGAYLEVARLEGIVLLRSQK